MTDNQTNFKTMAKTNMSYMDLKNLIWTGNTKVTGHVTYIKGELVFIDADEMIQMEATTGSTTDQNEAWMVAAIESTHIATGLKGYYLDIDDHTNYDKVNFTLWDFYKCTKDKALERMNIVHTHAAALPILSLNEFSVTALEISAQATAIQTFSDAVPVKKNMTDAVKIATVNIATHISNIRKRYKKLDLVINAMKPTKPDFVLGYNFSKEIINVGKGYLTADLNMMPLQNETSFGNKIEAGYSVTAWNHSDYAAEVGLAAVEHGPIVSTPAPLEARTKKVFQIPETAVGMTAHYFCVHNPSSSEDVHVTLTMAKGKSTSEASLVELSGIPK